jgi:hypothetical protein
VAVHLQAQPRNIHIKMDETKYDNFYSPKNADFYSKFQYVDLNPVERRIRLLRIHPLNYIDDTGATIRCDLLDNVSMESMKST